MKGGLAMMLVAVLRAKAEGLTPAGDVVLAVLSDEEAGGDFGAGFLVERHAEEFRDIRYAIGEFGGFPLYIGRKKFYTIQIAEKQICWMRATVRGPSGHASQPMRGGASAKLGRLLVQLDESILPPHITPVARMMIEKMASALPFHAGFVLRQVLKPSVMKYVLRWLGERGKLFEPLLRNTVNATTVRGGEKTNVIPGEIVVELDGRLLPGYGPQDMIQELRRIVDKDVEIEIVRCDVGTGKPEMGMFRMLADILVEGDSDCVPLPLLLTGSSDARFFKRLGIQTYGFLPMNLPESFNFVQFIHGADERIPVEALTFGARAMYKVLERYSFSVDL
jgi:acetylornithine deacetylase/succinyl-diaminopimelate desuccinylase-like protein